MLLDAPCCVSAAPRCVETPCKSCKRCLQDFSSFVNDPTRMALTSADALGDAFKAACLSTGRQEVVCNTARLGVAASFRGQAAKRAGAICTLLSECNRTSVTGCRYVGVRVRRVVGQVMCWLMLPGS